MRPLRIKPAHPITRLALSPDGRQLAVCQSHLGTRVFDTLDGRLVFLTPHGERSRSTELSPTERYFLSVGKWALTFAEVAAGRPWVPFQTGWRREGEINHPPAEVTTIPLVWPDPSSLAPAIGRLTLAGSAVSAGGWSAILLDALSTDHRFAAGRPNLNSMAVMDLARGDVCATLRWPDVRTAMYELRAVFGPGNRLFAGGLHDLYVYDLPPARDPVPPPAPPEPKRSVFRRLTGAVVQRGRKPPPAPPPPKLDPVLTIPLSTLQPDHMLPPFAVLPCGTKIIVRGEKSRIELRDVATGDVLTVWKWGLPHVLAVAVSGDGLTAAAGGTGGQVMLWDLE